uniref:HTH CENPB-type domain-containing protein n=1 Tax=Ditylenchus dipsaci TaxID=166011 RepID=A0A915ECL7_9BILA
MAKGSKRKRLEGAGRPVLEPELDSELAEWIREMRESKKPVSRSIIRMKAVEVFRSNKIKSQATTAVLKELGIETALIPGGCTKFIQVGEIS